MTEKRFTWLKKDIYTPQIVITDNLTEKDLTPIDCYNLLNKQHKIIHSLKIENDELRREVNLLTEFFRKNNFSLDDFNEWLTQEKWRWEAKEAWSENFGN